MFENPFMKEALQLAYKAGAEDEVPIGAVVARDGEIIGAAYNRVITDKDPTAHAEILAIKAAAKEIDSERLVGCDIYVTLEPCPMCAQAITFARINRLYFGAFDPKGGGVENGPKVFNSTSCHHKPEVYGGIDEEICSHVLKEFFKDKR